MKKFSELLIFFLFIYLFREKKREMTIERGYRLYSSCLFLGMGGSVDDSFSGWSN
jgi:hypothetical protein